MKKDLKRKSNIFFICIMDSICKDEIDRLFAGSMYLFGFLTIIIVSLSNTYTKMERALSYKIIELEERLKYIETGSETESETESEIYTNSENEDDVIVSERWQYSNTI